MGGTELLRDPTHARLGSERGILTWATPSTQVTAWTIPIDLEIPLVLFCRASYLNAAAPTTMQAYLYTTEEQEVFDLAAPNALEAISNFD